MSRTKSIKPHQIFFFILAVEIPYVMVKFITYTNRPEVRYSGMSCIYETIYAREGAADIVTIGSSRALKGISATVVAENMATDEDLVTVLNLARSWRGHGQLYRQIEDAIDQIGINTAVVLELSFFAYKNSRNTNYYYGYYPNYAIVANSDDFLDDYHSKPREPHYSKIRDLIGHYLTRLDKHATIYLTDGGTRNMKASSKPKKETISAGCSKRDNKHKPAALSQRENRVTKNNKTWVNFKPREWDIEFINEDRPRYYIGKIKELAERHGIKFFYC